MHPAEIEERIGRAATLYREQRHPDALATLESVAPLLPNSPVVHQMRIENLAALGRTDEAVHECEKLMHRLDQIRAAGDILDDLFDIDQ